MNRLEIKKYLAREEERAPQGRVANWLRKRLMEATNEQLAAELAVDLGRAKEASADMERRV